MSWSDSEQTGARRTLSYDKNTAMIGQVRLDYDSPEGIWPSIKVHTNVLFYGTTTRTVEEIVGLSQTGATNMCNATGAQESTYKVSVKTVFGVAAELLFESYNKTTTMRRVDPSGQYAVTVTTTSQTTDGTEHPVG